MDETLSMGDFLAERLLRSQKVPRAKTWRARRWRRRLDDMDEVPAAVLNLSRRGRGNGQESWPRTPAAARNGCDQQVA